MTRKFPRLFCLIALVVGLVSPAAFALTNMATGLTAGVGVAADPAGNAVYYVDWNAGTLRKIRLMPPECTAATPCPVSTVASGFSHPQDVALDMAHNHAYVSTRDDPGTTGSLWRVDLGSGAKTLITFNLGAPHQIVLDMATNTAYVVGFDIGRLWKINLATGSKSTVGIGLDHPVGLAVTADRTRAYITEQPAVAAPRLAEYDIATHVRIRNVVTGLTAPFFVSWTDAAQIALYLVQRSPVNNVLRVDLTAATSVPVIAGLPLGASGIALDAFGSVAYVTADQFVVRADLATLDMGEPVFVAVGHVPSTKIVDGYATTNPGYFFQVKDSPFGGTLNIFGNFNIWKSLGATHYRVKVSKDGGAPSVLALSWNSHLFSTVSNQYELTAVGPVPGTANRYAIPAEYPLLATRWWPPFLMMQWPSGANGMYTFSVEIWKLTPPATWTDLTPALPALKNKLTVKIDNDPPIVDLTKIRNHTTGTELDTCAVVSTPPFPPPTPPGPLTLDFKLTANDPNGHLLSYGVTAYFGHNSPPATAVPADSYASHVNADGLHLWKGPAPNLIAPPAGWTPPCNCAYTFFLDVWKRTIDGYSYLLHGQSHQSITIMNAAPAGTTCP